MSRRKPDISVKFLTRAVTNGNLKPPIKKKGARLFPNGLRLPYNCNYSKNFRSWLT